jgi:hypothetical protein
MSHFDLTIPSSRCRKKCESFLGASVPLSYNALPHCRPGRPKFQSCAEQTQQHRHRGGESDNPLQSHVRLPPQRHQPCPRWTPRGLRSYRFCNSGEHRSSGLPDSVPRALRPFRSPPRHSPRSPRTLESAARSRRLGVDLPPKATGTLLGGTRVHGGAS